MRVRDRLGALGERNYRLLLTGQVLSQAGDQMTPVAVSFAILDRGGSARQVGIVLGAGTASMVVLLLVGGAIADRLPRRLIMLSADTLRFVVQAWVAILLISGHWQVWQLATLEALWGVGAAFFNPALTGILPQMVSDDHLGQANSLQAMSWSLGGVIGPALAGGLVAAFGAGTAVAVDAASFAVSALSLSRVRLPARVPPTGEPSGLIRDLRVGWKAFTSRRWLWAIVAEFGLWHLFVFAPFIVLGAVVAKTHLGGAPAWGLILSAFGVGAIAGAALTLRWHAHRPLLAATLATLGFAPLPALLAQAAPVVVIAPVAFVAGGGFAVFGILWDTTLQRHVPNDLLSRVSAYDWLGSVALLPVGFVIAGPIAAVIGIPATLWGSSLFMLVAVGAVLAVPEVRHLPAQPLGDGPGTDV